MSRPLRFLLLLLGLSPLAAFAQPERRLPNVVVILVDDLGYRDLGCQGCEDFTTPHIDALATAGVRLTNGYVSHPYCSPSRAGILTGRYQQRFGHEHNLRYDEGNTKNGTAVTETMLPSLLARAGYATTHNGNWHVGAGEPFRPLARGYDEFFGFLGGGHHYFKADGEGEYRTPLWRGAQVTATQPTYLTDDFTDEALAFMERNRAKPFFVMLAYNAPHSPDHVPPRYLEPVKSIPHKARRRYAGLVRGIDAGVGRITARLRELKLEQDTLVVFLSDNGGRRGSSDNRPLRGNKGWLHEGGIRVPFLWKWPRSLPAGVTYDGVVSSLDVLPTALAAAGVSLPSNLDGVDVRAHLRGEAEGSPHPTLHWRVCGGAGYAVRHGPYKLVHDVSMKAPALYDLSKDPGENNDLSATHEKRLDQLRRRHLEWARTLRAPIWTDGHLNSITMERRKAREAGARQFPMPWVR